MIGAAEESFDIALWPNGRVPFRFADTTDIDRWDTAAVPLSSGDVTEVLVQMWVWNTAMALRDPRSGDGPGVQLWPHKHGTDAMFCALFRV